MEPNPEIMDELKTALTAIMPWFVFWHALYRVFQVLLWFIIVMI